MIHFPIFSPNQDFYRDTIKTQKWGGGGGREIEKEKERKNRKEVKRDRKTIFTLSDPL